MARPSRRGSAAASRHMLHRAIGATMKQWNWRIETARRSGGDLAPVVVSLLVDAGDVDGARRVQLIAAGLAGAETGHSSQAITVEAVEPPPTYVPEAIVAPEPIRAAPVRTPKRKAT
jgi:hypothetical protein